MVIAAASARLSMPREQATHREAITSSHHHLVTRSSRHNYPIGSSTTNDVVRARASLRQTRGAPFLSIDCRRTELIREGLRPATGRSSQMLSLLVARGLSRATGSSLA